MLKEIKKDHSERMKFLEEQKARIEEMRQTVITGILFARELDDFSFLESIQTLSGKAEVYHVAEKMLDDVIAKAWTVGILNALEFILSDTEWGDNVDVSEYMTKGDQELENLLDFMRSMRKHEHVKKMYQSLWKRIEEIYKEGSDAEDYNKRTVAIAAAYIIETCEFMLVQEETDEIGELLKCS